MKQYSLLKGLEKSIGAFLLFAVGFAIMLLTMTSPQTLDVSLWALVEQYLKPVLGSATIGSALIFINNWLKNRNPE